MSKALEPDNSANNPELSEMKDSPWGIFYSFPARLLSYAGAIAVTAYLFMFPSTIASSAANVNHMLLSLLLLGTSAGFIHGSGFVPRMIVWKILFSPLFAWPALIFGLVYMTSSLY